MRMNLQRVVLVLGSVVGTATLASVAVVGCGGDDTQTTPADSGVDGTAGDARTDVSTGDAPSDTSPDTATDGSRDGGSDSSGDGAADADAMANPDAPALSDFSRAVTTAYCKRFGDCCLLAASQYNINGCINDTEQYGGGFRSLSSYNAAIDSGTIAYDKAAAAKCLSEIAALPCGIITATDLVRFQNDCFAAMKGTLANGAGPCVNSLQCANGYCQLQADGGPGTCAALVADGGTCTLASGEQCSYLGNGAPALFCALDGGSGHCVPAKPDDAGCSLNVECSSQTCAYPSCVSGFVFSDPGVPNGYCTQYAIKDAGGGG